MHDIRAIRADPAAFDAAMARRRLPPKAADILGLCLLYTSPSPRD